MLGGAFTDRDDYSPIHDTISQLAQIGANTRPLMTSGMVAFGIALPAYAVALRRALPGPAWVAAAATGISTIGVALAPLERSSFVDGLHALTAGSGYITLGAIPILAYKPLVAAGHTRLARFGLVAAAISGASLVTSVLVDQTGFFQRLGLTVGDTFVIASVPVVISLLREQSLAD